MKVTTMFVLAVDAENSQAWRYAVGDILQTSLVGRMLYAVADNLGAAMAAVLESNLSSAS